MNRYHHDRLDSKEGAITFAMLCLVTLVLITYGAWAYFNHQAMEPEQGMQEGEAKAIMIKQLTGKEIPPEVAKWATVSFSGSSVSIDTHTINLWDGKKWREIKR